MERVVRNESEKGRYSWPPMLRHALVVVVMALAACSSGVPGYQLQIGQSAMLSEEQECFFSLDIAEVVGDGKSVGTGYATLPKGTHVTVYEHHTANVWKHITGVKTNEYGECFIVGDYNAFIPSDSEAARAAATEQPVTSQTTPKPTRGPSMRPYATTVVVGDLDTAVQVYGEGRQPNVPGHDAMPAFQTKASYDRWYKYADGDTCHGPCIAPIFSEMKNDGELDVVAVGTPVEVLAEMDDPKAPEYPICQIRVHGHERIILCAALKPKSG